MLVTEVRPQEVLEGFPCYAPEIARGGPDFPEDAFDRLSRIEDGHFWFRGRQRIIEHLVRRFLAGRHAVFLEIGCGTGYVLKGLSRFPELELIGAEAHLQGLRWARRRVPPQVQLIQLDALHLPFAGAVDAIGAFDVVEHIEQDGAVLAEMAKALRPGGHLFLTVPQHAWLWSSTDVYARHKRRYSRGDLAAKLRAAGFQLRWAGSFVTLLLPAMALSRFRKNRTDPPACPSRAEIQVSPLVNAVGEAFLRLEGWLIRRGVRPPVGGSLAIVARKERP